MLFLLIQIWPWLLAALALGAAVGFMARAAAADLVLRSELPDMRLYALKSAIPPVSTAPAEVVRSAQQEVVASAPAEAVEAPQAEPVQLEAVQLQAVQLEALHNELATRDTAIAELRAGLEREVTLRRAAIARLEGLMAELASPTAPSTTPPDAPR